MNEHAHSETDCFVCLKHRGEILVPGGAVYEDQLIYVGHASISDDETEIYLGFLMVEPKRHVPGMAELDDVEAGAIGRMITRLSRALKEREGAEHVYLFRLGHHVDHLHLWVVPRYPGTPREYWGLRVDEWPQAPRGDADAVEALCERIRRFLQQDGN
ncbi:MAG: HIT domain-containing protein [Anaerolineales bacterium]|nr:HIT domain-containing protein [Anaerolineales bacterium]